MSSAQQSNRRRAPNSICKTSFCFALILPNIMEIRFCSYLFYIGDSQEATSRSITQQNGLHVLVSIQEYAVQELLHVRSALTSAKLPSRKAQLWAVAVYIPVGPYASIAYQYIAVYYSGTDTSWSLFALAIRRSAAFSELYGAYILSTTLCMRARAPLHTPTHRLANPHILPKNQSPRYLVSI